MPYTTLTHGAGWSRDAFMQGDISTEDGERLLNNTVHAFHELSTAIDDSIIWYPMSGEVHIECDNNMQPASGRDRDELIEQIEQLREEVEAQEWERFCNQ